MPMRVSDKEEDVPRLAPHVPCAALSPMYAVDVAYVKLVKNRLDKYM